MVKQVVAWDKDRFVGGIHEADEEVQETVLIVVHPTDIPIYHVRSTSRHWWAGEDFGERAVAVVVEQGIGLVVRTDKQVEVTVVVVVAPPTAIRGAAGGWHQLGAGKHPREHAVALIMVKLIAAAGSVGHEQVGKAVIVIVAPGGGCCPLGPGVGGNDVGENPAERAVPVIVVKEVFSCGHVGADHEQVRVAVIVVVLPDSAKTVLNNVI